MVYPIRRGPSVPRRDDITSVLIIGSGPIVIGQAAEFDYSGTQACRALRDEGYRVVLVNSNPATIMTDPEVADATYVEPLIAETVAEILRRERPDALLPTLGGQTALNLAVELHETGILDELDVELLGASIPSIRKAEDRQLFSEAMQRIGLKVPASRTVRKLRGSRGAGPGDRLPPHHPPQLHPGRQGRGHGPRPRRTPPRRHRRTRRQPRQLGPRREERRRLEGVRA